MRNCCRLALILCTPCSHASADQSAGSGRSGGHQFFTQRVSVGSHWMAPKHLTAFTLKCAWKFQDRSANAPASSVWMHTHTHNVHNVQWMRTHTHTHNVQVCCKIVLAFVTFHLISFFPCVEKYWMFFCFLFVALFLQGARQLLRGHCRNFSRTCWLGTADVREATAQNSERYVASTLSLFLERPQFCACMYL